MISELTKRGMKFDGPAMTMLRLRVTSSQNVVLAHRAGVPVIATRVGTMAELSPAEKHAISHRGRAARALARYLTRLREVERR